MEMPCELTHPYDHYKADDTTTECAAFCRQAAACLSLCTASYRRNTFITSVQSAILAITSSGE